MTITSSQQLKDLVRNLSDSDSAKAQSLMRIFAAERFFERLSKSQYHDRFIIKGGILVMAMVGVNHRSTMDIDATVKNLPLTKGSIGKLVETTIEVALEDGVSFSIKKIDNIMDEADYPGIRVRLDAKLEGTLIPMQIDFSTDSVITPHEITFPYQLLFENRTIPILAYNLETVLAEKLETVISRSVANTRMRDFYDIYTLESNPPHPIDYSVLKNALENTGKKRSTDVSIKNMRLILEDIRGNPRLIHLWANYRKKFIYATDIEWASVIVAIERLFETR